MKEMRAVKKSSSLTNLREEEKFVIIVTTSKVSQQIYPELNILVLYIKF